MKKLPFYAAVLFSCSAWGQTANGTVTGQVRDSSGALVPGAKVVLTNEGTGIAQMFTTDQAGIYRFPLVPAGHYEITIEKTGFRTVVQKNVDVHVNEIVTVDVALEVGQLQDTVTVAERPPLLQVSSAETGGVIERSYIQDLPLSRPGARQMADTFTLMLPGVQAGRDRTLGRFSGEGFVSNGSQAKGRDLLIEGASYSEMDSPGRMISQLPPPDAIQEFKMSTGAYSAEFGRSQGGLINLSIRSGTNQFHGSLTENLRNNIFDARGFFNQTVPQDTQNEFGATFGGPIIHNRTFFFGYYNGFRWRTVLSNSLVTMPTQAMLNGDFSALLSSQPLYDPATGHPNGQGGTTRDPFPSNIVPRNRFSAVSQNILPFFPALTYPNLTTLNYLTATTEATNDDRFGIKIDHALTSKQQLSGFFQFGTFYRNDLGPLPLPIANGAYRQQYTRMLRLNHHYTLAPNLLWNTQAAYNRDRTPFAIVTAGQPWAEKLGLKGITPNAGFPFISFGGAANSLSGEGNETTTENSFLYASSLNWIKGRHSIKFGVDFRKLQFNDMNFNRQHGSFNFSSAETSLPDSPNRGRTGNGFASFLLGAVDSSTVAYITTVPGYRFTYTGLFIQDDFRISQKLTLNLGLRYEVPVPLREVADRLSFFDPTALNAAAGGHPGALVFAGNGPGRIGKPTVVATDWREWGPRVGLAYKLTAKTVVRTGYGIFYGLGGDINMNGPGNYNLLEGYNANISVASLDTGITPAYYWDSGVPAPAVVLPTFDPTFANNRSVSNFDRPEDGRVPYMQEWNFTVQRQFGQNLSLQAGYVGSKGTRLSSQLLRPNQVDPKYLSLGPLLTQPASSSAAQAAGITLPYPGFTGTVAQALRPFPQYQTISVPHEALGNSTYHSLQIMANKRTSFGLTFLASYTWSKNISNVFSQVPAENPGPMDAFNPGLEKAVSIINVPHVLTYSILYELPVGRGRQFASGVSGLAGALASGWSLGVVTRYQSGFPIRISGGVPTPLFAGQRPNVVLGVNPRTSIARSEFDPATSLYLNKAAYATVGPYAFGNAPPQDPKLRGWAFYNEDVSFIKQVRVREKVEIRFAAQFYNIFNRTVFNDPDSNINSLTFGRVSGQANFPRQMQYSLRLAF